MVMAPDCRLCDRYAARHPEPCACICHDHDGSRMLLNAVLFGLLLVSLVLVVLNGFNLI